MLYRPLITLSVLGFILCWCGWGLCESYWSSSWPTAQSTITDNQINRHVQSRVGERIETQLTYKYKVDGKEYSGSRIFIRFPIMNDGYIVSSKEADKIEKKYARGAKLNIHYNPVFPSTSTIVSGPTAAVQYIAFGVSHGVIVSGILACATSFRMSVSILMIPITIGAFIAGILTGMNGTLSNLP